MGEFSGRQNWKQDPEGVQRAIVEAATRVFARSGYASTRIEDIVAETETSKRMIYYYFTDKEGEAWIYATSVARWADARPASYHEGSVLI